MVHITNIDQYDGIIVGEINNIKKEFERSK